jgi:membrane fusion protein (multidrug efflux system)
MDAKPFQVQVDAQAASLARQQAGFEVARADLERTKPLAAQNALSQKDLDDATGQYMSSAAAVEEAKARLETARLNLSYCTIVSPVTGITGAALQQDGTYISPQNSLLTTVAVLSPMWVNFSLSENEMQAVREQVASGRLRPPKDGNYIVEVLLVDGSLFPHTGRITFASPSFNAQTGTFLLRASVANPDGILRPNAYVRVRLTGAVRPGAITVPQRAVQQGSSFVWVIDEEGGGPGPSDWQVAGATGSSPEGAVRRPGDCRRNSRPPRGHARRGKPAESRQGRRMRTRQERWMRHVLSSVGADLRVVIRSSCAWPGSWP